MIRAAQIARSVAVAIRLTGIALLVPLLASLALDPWNRRVLGSFELPATTLAFGLCAALAAALWLPLRIASNRSTEPLSDREGYVGAALGWVAAALIAATPFLLLRALGPLPSFFEAMSGLTGTGITALANLDAVPRSLLFWRSFLQWVGALAAIILALSLVARLTHGGLLWMGPARARWRIAEVAQSVGAVYLVLTLGFAVLFDAVLTFRHGLTGMDALLESLTQVFAAYGNGAFTLHDSPLLADDPVLASLRAAMMVAGALGLPVAIVLARRHAVRNLGANPEARFFLALLAAACLATVAATWNRDAAASLQATVAIATGAGVAATPALPPFATLLLILTAVTGGTIASAAGGITSYRTLVLLKSVGRELRRILHPHAVIPLRVGGRVVPEESVMAIIAFFFTFVTAWILGAGTLALLEPTLDLQDAATGSLAALGNVAFGTGPLAGPDGYAHLGLASQAVLTALMWVGRLGVFATLLVFLPSTWRK